MSARPDEVREVAELIASAFESLPPSSWLVPEPDQRRRVLAADFHILVGYALAGGLVEVTEDRSAVAVWFPNVGDPAPAPADYDARLAAATGPWADRFRTLDELFDANHPIEAHHHLAFLAVAPDRQGRGIGTALLRQHHARLDEQGIPAYLEASCERNRDFYRRHGYQDREPFRLPDGTPFWPMWRTPR
ncbi:MAG TPA: GNAT family N-acetyltransferase [Micromonosporaceae bacterium]|nr:GNAT family N-acetyltransferase [Micromonosporaceae bacterium]